MTTTALDHVPADSPIRTLAAELQRQLKTKRDVLTDTRRLTFEPTEGGVGLLLDVPDEGVLEFGVNDYAHGQVADALDLPVKTYRRLHDAHPDLLCHLTNGLVQREPAKQMLRVMDGRVRAYLSNKYRVRDNWDLLNEAILPALGEHGTDGLYFKECTLTDSRMYVKVVLPLQEWPITPREGDVIRGGLIVRNSEVGDGSLQVAPYTDRLICTNGLVHTDYGMRAAHVGSRVQEESWNMYSDDTLRKDDEAFFAKCRDTVANVLNHTVFEAIVAQMRDLAGIPLANPVGAVEDVTRKHDLTEAESKSMLSVLAEGGDVSAWGLVNAMTQTARDHDSPDRRYDLEALAGRITGDWALAGVRS